ncbi:MAG: YgiQ family radical SAM protein [Candidatus Sumerlaeia bacterium]|nr:YgiQ family radical SAM protein [Candidatus Sumerlaeia bacterium]
MSELTDYVVIPSFEEVQADRDKFNLAFKQICLEADPFSGRTIVQKSDQRYVIQFPPPLPMTTAELDKIYELNYARNWHPIYNQRGGVPGFETVKFSIISHRGCCGECSFCSLYFHQGRIVQSRSAESIIREVKLLTSLPDFKGTITDIGGPTANLYKAECERWSKEGACKYKKCLVPTKCKRLKVGYDETLKLWEAIRNLPGVKHLFIGSGVRYDLLIDDYAEEYLTTLCKYHISGQLKVAPEHNVDSVLEIMNKPPFKVYQKFVEKFRTVNKHLNKQQYLVNYFISSHPGADLTAALNLALYLVNKRIHPEQIQDFIPLPMTLAGCIYYTEKHPFTGQQVYVAKTFRERKMQRALLQYKNPKNKQLIIEALKLLNKFHLRKLFLR